MHACAASWRSSSPSGSAAQVLRSPVGRALPLASPPSAPAVAS
jgi:hypothetical protein